MRGLGKATVFLLMLESPDADMKPLRKADERGVAQSSHQRHRRLGLSQRLPQVEAGTKESDPSSSNRLNATSRQMSVAQQ